MTSEASDRDLVKRCRTGESAAFAALVGRYLRPTVAIAWEYVPSLDDAEDLAQDAFHRALKNLRRFDERKPFGPWLFTIVRNLGRNEAARRKRWGGGEADMNLAAQSDPHRDAESAEIVDRIEVGLAGLPQMQRTCFRLCQVEGFGNDEVAEMLGIGTATVRTHVFRAKTALKQVLQVLHDERE